MESEALAQSFSWDMDIGERLWEEHMTWKKKTKMNDTSAQNNDDPEEKAAEFEVLCRNLKFEKVRMSQNVLQYWEARKLESPQMYEIARIISVSYTHLTLPTIYSV